MNPMLINRRQQKRDVPPGGVRPVVTLLLVVSAGLLNACASTTSGSFNPDASGEEALQSYLQLSSGYLEQGDLANARRHLNNAAAIDSNNSEIYGIRALLDSRSGDTDLAEENFLRSLELDGHNSQTRNNYAAFLYADGRYEEAYEQLQTVVQDTEYRNRPQAFENLGLAALRLEREEAAFNAFDRAIQLNPNQARSLLELSNISLHRAQVGQAQRYYQHYLTVTRFYSLDETARELWLGIRLARASGDSARLQELASTLQSAYPDSPETALYRQSLNQ